MIPPRAFAREILILCEQCGVDGATAGRLRLAQDVAIELGARLADAFSELVYNQAAVQFGAATHAMREAALVAAGIDPDKARFARTHTMWRGDDDLPLEDLLVALVVTIATCRRTPELEMLVAEAIATPLHLDPTGVYLALDEILGELAAEDDARREWQARQQVEPAYVSRGLAARQSTTMRIFIAGATGVLGRRLVAGFVARGHAVVGLARSSEKGEAIRALGGEPRPADIYDAASLAKAARGCDVVIHAATSIPASTRIRAADFQANDRLRRQGTMALVQCAAEIGAKAYLQQSIVWVAQPADGSRFDESSPPHPDRLSQSALDGEEIALAAGAKYGFAPIILRCGRFYSADAYHTRYLRDAIRRRLLPILGSGQARWSLIHASDAASAFLDAAQLPARGIWHVVDDEPVEVGIFLTELAKQLYAKPPYRLPIWLGRWLASRELVDIFTRSLVTSNAKLKRDFGWRPQYPTYREGWAEIVAMWEREPG